MGGIPELQPHPVSDMHAKHTLRHHRKYRQFRYLIKKVNRLQRSGKYAQLAEQTKETIKRKLEHLYSSLTSCFPQTALKTMLAGILCWSIQGAAADLRAQSTPNFSPPLTNPFSLTPAPTDDFHFPHAVDIDGDGDLDIMAVSSYGIVNFYANTGSSTNPTFNFPTTFPFGFTYLNSSFAAHFVDLDGDGDLDLVAGGTYGQLDYFENTGQVNNPAFGAAVPNPFGLDSIADVSNPEFGDLDGDGDMDLMLNDGNNNWIYVENIGSATAPAFANQVINPFGLGGGFQANYEVHCFGDLDQDGDLDIYSALYDGNHRYFENVGTPTAPSFANPTQNPYGLQPWTGPFFPDLADLDGDGDLDLLASEYGDGNWFYYENNSIVGVGEAHNAAISMEAFPNPASNRMFLSWTSEHKGPGSVRILDLAGKEMQREAVPNGLRGQQALNLADLPSGIYLVEIQLGGKTGRKRIVKN